MKNAGAKGAEKTKRGGKVKTLGKRGKNEGGRGAEDLKLGHHFMFSQFHATMRELGGHFPIHDNDSGIDDGSNDDNVLMY